MKSMYAEPALAAGPTPVNVLVLQHPGWLQLERIGAVAV